MSLSHAARSVRRGFMRRGFTLIEVLLVIAIIAILAVLALTVGSKVAGSAKISATKERLKALDTSLATYMKVKGGYPGPYVADPRVGSLPQPASIVIPIIDGQYGNASSPPLNSLGLYMLQCKGLPEVENAWRTLGSDALKEVDPDDTASGGVDFKKQPRLLTVLDGWGRPIRYVHPTFHGYVHQSGNPLGLVDTDKLIEPGVTGKQLQFEITPLLRHPPIPSPAQPGNGDGGLTTGGKPYFYSAGPDGDPSTTDDNVYLDKPSFQKVP